MDRPRIKFNEAQIEAFCDKHMEQLPNEVIEYIKEQVPGSNNNEQVFEGIMNIFYMGLFTGIVNGICSFSDDVIEGFTKEDTNNEWYPVQ